ncbi:MAG TPA: hypothetical protein VKU02_28690 [Gemmataceae bacterium]|nr:hypothetical protein [Gemmataceae bacterium]
MGAEAWDYFVPYEEDIEQALEKLRQEEFRAGRFRGAEFHPATIDEAFENSEEDGTASILDITHIADEPEFFAVTPLPRNELVRLFGTDQPTRKMIEATMLDIYEEIDRGQGIYIIAHKDGKPSEIFFGGYSFD